MITSRFSLGAIPASLAAVAFKSTFVFLIIFVSSTTLSIEETNVVLFFVTIVGVAQIAQLGFNVTYLRYFTYSNSGINASKFRKVADNKCVNSDIESSKQFYCLIYSAKKVYVVLSIFLIISLLIFGSLLLSKPASQVDDRTSVLTSWLIVLLTVPITFYLSLYRTVLEGMKKILFVQKVLSICYFFSCLDDRIFIKPKSNLNTDCIFNAVCTDISYACFMG